VLKQYDVIIAGSGVAGLYCALNFPEDKKILVLCKDRMEETNTDLAQGGVAAVLDLVEDSFDLHINDTMIAGHHENDPQAVQVLVEEGPDDVRRLANQLDVVFDKRPDGSLNATLEGGHSRRRIVHHKDSTGHEISQKLCQAVKKQSHIDILEHTVLYHLDRIDGGFFAHLLQEDHTHVVAAPYVVLATGGIGQVYRYTTNSPIATGDGIRLAWEMGCKISHLDYVQFHPSSFAGGEATTRQRFLISEAVRGEGAYLLNCKKERFMHLYDKRLELAPRDVVAKSIILESRRQADEHFYLDIAYKGEEFLKKRFPMIYEKCLQSGVDITKEPIPIFPCHHYLMGGIRVNINGKTDIDRLYAAGECSCTGVHGKNRLASNSLLEGLVFGRRVAQDICRKMQSDSFTPPPLPTPDTTDGAPLPKGLDKSINDIMQRASFVLPDMGAVREGLKTVDRYIARLKSGHFALTREYVEVLSLATVAHIILKEIQER
jgi:L-aspartate oxidase